MYEKGTRKPSLEVLIQLSDIFGCSIDYLLNRSDIRNNLQPSDPFGLAEMGIDAQNYSPPTAKQKEQLAELIKIILRDNKK